MYESKIKQIADYYGLEEQLVQTAEECSELGKAALKLRRALNDPLATDEDKLVARNNFIEEMADVLVMIEQQCHLNGCETDVKNIVLAKVDRQIERIYERNAKA